ncbi:energy transducer TonB [Dokdonia sp.]|uniref:energy transducer TonB n=1 Tax=Dokdonia sp. TaxID=2024995 RepID=UPI0032678FC0
MKDLQESKDVRQNGTYTKSRKHEANLRRNTTVHFQIGLILSLLIAIFFIEMRMPTKALNGPSNLELDDPEWTIEVQMEQKKVEKITQKRPPKAPVQQPEEFEIIDDKEPELIEDLVDAIEPDQNEVIPTNIIETTKEVIIDDPETIVDFVVIEDVPVFPGCEGLTTNEDRKACMNSKISKFIGRKFRSEKGEGLGLEGVNRIFVQFTIDKSGVVTNIKTRGPRKELEQEAGRVVKLLPKMTPGKQRGVPVGVVYNLPISFTIQD